MKRIIATFKHEGEVKAADQRKKVPFGPFTIIDENARAADPKVVGTAMPFGYKPAWLATAWMTLPEAEQFARVLRLELHGDV